MEEGVQVLSECLSARCKSKVQCLTRILAPGLPGYSGGRCGATIPYPGICAITYSEEVEVKYILTYSRYPNVVVSSTYYRPLTSISLSSLEEPGRLM